MLRRGAIKHVRVGPGSSARKSDQPATFARWILGRRRAEANLDPELRAYVEMSADDGVAGGLTQDEANRLVRADLGGLETARERVRSGRHGWRLDEIARDMRHAWRRLLRLVAAGFANDLRAHLVWVPKVLPPAAFDAWRAGRLPDGVRFGPGAEVVVTTGWAKGQRATILDLARVDPEPTYRATVASGREVVIGQSLLSSADPGPGDVNR